MKARNIAVIWVAFLFSPANAANFFGLGDLPGGGASSFAYAVSADGAVIVGASESAAGVEAFRWTAAGGMVGLGDLSGGGFSSEAHGVSGDGSVIVGSSLGFSGREAFQWTESGGMIGLGDLSGGSFESQAYAISVDGTTIVGFGLTAPTAQNGFIGQQAVRWDDGGPAVSIGGTYANAVSANGQVIVGRRSGTSGDEAFLWSAISGIKGLGDLPGGSFSSQALSISADGMTVVGQGWSEFGSEAFYWTEAAGLVGLGDLPGGAFYSYAWYVSADGGVIIGTGKTSRGDEAFIWDPVNGMRNLRDVLTYEFGITNLAGWTLSAARAISLDGTTIVGDGVNPSGEHEAWVVTGIPEPSASVILVTAAIAVGSRRRRSLHTKT